MRRYAYLAGGSALALSLAIGFGGVAAAQSEPADVDAVIVTGSLIAGTPEDAALPVDVIGQEELAKQGSPTTVELLKGLSVSNGVLGDTNQFDARAQGSEGSGSVNLRGLGPTRTLVLLNGRRMPVNPFALAGAGAVDTNIIPSAAIGRVEVLKDGAAATYGSDAIGGVVNFITRKNFEGGELGVSYRVIDGSDGDYTASFLYGWSGENVSFLITAGAQHRSELPLLERDNLLLDYEDNPEGGWSAAGNPNTYVPLGATTTGFRDDSCYDLGGRNGFSGVTPVCHWQYTQYDNLVELENRFQIFSELNIALGGDTNFRFEFLYASTDVPEWKTSPSYALLAVPTAAGSPIPGRYFVPGNNPGLQAYLAAHPGGLASYSLVAASPTPVLVPIAAAAPGVLAVANRPYALGGNPMFDYYASRGERNFDAYRWVAELNGKWGDTGGWNISVTYGEEKGNRTGYDTIVNRYALALRGLGGANCNGIVAGNPGSTCEWANPFGNSIPQNPITGQTTSQYNPALQNSEELTRWFFQKLETKQKTTLWVAEAVINGQFGELGGGPVGWAIGSQYRVQGFQAEYNDISNRAQNPCLDTPINGSKACTAPQGPFGFLGVGSEGSVEQDSWSVFGEVVFPFSDNFNATLAARYEDFGGETTFDPKLSARWQIADWIAVRGSVGTTFRAPVPNQLTNDFVTSLQSILGTFRAVDIYGNPGLSPETATTYNIGLIVEAGGFKATVDYFNFDFQDPITTDPVAGIVNAVFPNGAAGANNCANPTFAPLVARFTFTGGVCAAGNIQRLRTNTVNGAEVQTSGIDILADYSFDTDIGTITIGGSMTYVLEYQTGDTAVEGITVAQGFDAVGKLNYQTTAYPLPQWKGNLFFEWNNGPHNLRVTVRYIDEYEDQRNLFGTIYRNADATGTLFAQPNGQVIDSFVTTDITYRVFLPWDVTLAVAADNVFDEDPPFARLDLSYDPFTASGLGRTLKFNLTKKF